MARTKTDSGHSFEDYFKRAMNPLVILSLLKERPKYAYEMNQELTERSGGQYTMSLLYPVLYRLEEQGLIEVAETVISEKNRTRNYYRITEAGTAYLEEKKTEYRQLSQIVEKMLGMAGGNEA